MCMNVHVYNCHPASESIFDDSHAPAVIDDNRAARAKGGDTSVSASDGTNADGKQSGGGGTGGSAQAPADSFLPEVPRYSLPSVSSILPAYANSEQDFIRRAFTNANYDMLCSLPDTIRTNEVTRRRTELIHATLNQHIVNESGKSLKKATTNHGLFSEFQYKQDPYDNMDKLFRAEQEASFAVRQKFGGKFLSACNVSKAKYEELGDERRTLTYLCDPYEAAQNLQQRVKWMEESKILYGPFNPSGKAFNDVPQGAPTIMAEKETLDVIRRIFKEDWPGADVDIDVNTESKEWVVKAKIDDGTTYAHTHLCMTQPTIDWVNTNCGRAHTVHMRCTSSSSSCTAVTHAPDAAVFSVRI